MKSNSLTIGFLSITALILFIAQFIPVRPATAAVTLKDRDYSLVSARSARGGETIYVVDNRTGQIAVFSWDAGQRRLMPMAAGDLVNAFAR